ncbi:MAG: DR2241 family protein, partial [Verrucomicrobiaceae bacterium]
LPRSETSLVIVGHGTSLNEQSRKAIEAQVAFIREGGHGFAEVQDAYMEEAPLVAQWDEIASAPNVVVVPFFIADGLHSYQDIPVLLGMESEPTAAASQNEIFRHNPHQLRGRNLYYSSSVGTDDLMVDVILDQVHDAAVRVGTLNVEHRTWNIEPWANEFTIGQVRAIRQADGSWLLHHVADRGDDASLNNLSTVTEAREMTLTDEAGNFRALKTAPNLRRGWRLTVCGVEIDAVLDALYPGAPGLWRHFKSGTLNPVPLRETLGRQTGMYRFANTICDDDAERMITCECNAKTKCLRRITWKLTDSQPLTSLSSDKQPPHDSTEGNPALICVEACTHLVSAAREIAKANFATKNIAK